MPAVGAVELERVVDPALALLGEDGEQAGERQDGEEGRAARPPPRTRPAGRSGVSRRSTRKTQARSWGCSRGEMPSTSHSRSTEALPSNGELRGERRDIDGPVAPSPPSPAPVTRKTSAGPMACQESQTTSRARSGMRAPGEVVGQAPQRDARHHGEGHEPGRQQEEHGHEDQLCRRGVAEADGELHARGHRVGHDQQEGHPGTQRLVAAAAPSGSRPQGRRAPRATRPGTRAG